MKFKSIRVTDRKASIDHDLRTDSGKQIEWVADDGAVRTPEEQDRYFDYPGLFTAAGKKYLSLKLLCIHKDPSSPIGRDIYGREVFCVSKRFPCFDSYDYLHENRYYRWFFIKENGVLTRVYYSDGRPRLRVTEDVQNLENTCLEQMESHGWLK